MSDPCCQAKACELETLRKQQAGVLWLVLAVNAVMFGFEFWWGLRAHSLALVADSLDMLGDALVYAGSLYVVSKSVQAQARVAFLKGLIMFAFAIVVFARASYQFFAGSSPDATMMGAIGVLALLANLFCLLLLTRHRHDNLNMSSIWLCSRNDIIANLSVLVAALLVTLTDSPLPDLAIGVLLTVVFVQSGAEVLSQAWQALR